MRAHAQAACGRPQLAERISQMFKSSRLSARSRPPHVCTEDGEKAGKEREWSSLLLNPWQGSRAPSMTDRQTDMHARTHVCTQAWTSSQILQTCPLLCKYAEKMPHLCVIYTKPAYRDALQGLKSV